MAAPNSPNQTTYLSPHKNRDIDCFVCFSANVTSFKLCGKKLMDENFKDTLIYLLDHSLTRKQLKFIKETLDLELCSPALIPVTEIPKETVTLVRVCPTASVPDHGYSEQISTIKTEFNHDLLETIKKSVTSLDHRTAGILKDIRSQAATLTSRTTMLASVLYKYRDISNLADNAENLLADIVKEVQERIPFLFNVLCCVAIPASEKISRGIIPVLASCYSILMKHRYHNLSAFHRLTTTITTKGGLDERAQTRMNHLGLVLSSERRQRLQDSAQEKTLKLVTETLKSQPLVKITGDNLDFYVKTSNLGTDRRNKDLHLFT
ncbi:hypothetical protein ScPMuIL_008082 [Solemya velum]